MQDFKIYPTYDEVKNGIQSLIGYKWATFDGNVDIDQHIKKITDKLSEYFKALPELIYVHDEKIPLPINFYRARSFDSFQDFTAISEYKYKPINLTTEIQRCNFPYKPIFYSSNDAGTALMELTRNQPFDKERKYLISKWIIPDDSNTKVIPYLYADLPKENDFKLFGDKALERIPEIFEQSLTENQVEGLRLYFNFLASVFTSENYSLSASLAHRLLYANHNYRADLFLYPSVQTDRKSINIAIHPNYVDTKMKLLRIYSVRLNRINSNVGEYNITINKYAELVDSIIIWHNIDPDDEEYKKAVKEDFNFNGEFIFKPNNNAL